MYAFAAYLPDPIIYEDVGGVPQGALTCYIINHKHKMATLEKIRNKSVLLFVIIIVALLASILGDFLTSGRTYFGSPTTVAKAGDVSVDYQAYQNRISEISEQNQRNGRNLSSDAVAAEALNSLISEGLMSREYERLGITVTDAELNEAMFGANQSPMAAQLIANLSGALGLTTPDAHAVYNAVSNPAAYDITQDDAQQISAMLRQTETELTNQMIAQKFGRLVSGLFTYNKLDARNTYDNIATTRRVAYAVKDASAVANDEVEFSDADVQALWNSRRQEYAIDEERRQVDYIYVRIEPSQADRVAAANAVENAVLGLSTTEGLDAVAGDSRFVVETASVPLAQISDRALKQFVDTASVGSAAVVSRSSEEYTIAKLTGITMGIDSINVSMAQLANPAASADSIVSAINGGSTVASLMATGEVQGQDSVWGNLQAPGIEEKLRNALTDATVGRAFAFTDTVAGNPVTVIYKVNRRHAPVKFYDFAVATYTVDPSQETITDLSDRLRTYVSANSSASEFSANSSESGYPMLSDEVGNSSVRIGNADDSRRFVKWVMEAREGQVSPVFQDDKQTYLIALAVSDIYDDYRPYDSPRVYPQLQAEALEAKKADKLMEKYNGRGTDLASYAQAMETEIAEGDVNVNSPVLLNLGIGENEIAGAIAGTAQGKFAGPIKGNHGIMVFEVREVNTANRPFTEDEYGQLFLRNYTPLRNPQLLLLGKNKVDNRSLNFVSNPAE